jgi:hypothetical protein
MTAQVTGSSWLKEMTAQVTAQEAAQAIGSSWHMKVPT